MNLKVVADGKLEVHTDGTVYKIEKDGSRIPAVLCRAGREKKNVTVSVCIDGKQKLFQVSRLIAEAFLPNPEGKPIVGHKNGDSGNNCVDNLVWMTHKELAAISRVKMIKTRTVSCRFCGSDTINKDCICPECRQKMKVKAFEDDRKRKQEEQNQRIDETISRVDLSKLTDSEARVIRLRQQHLTLDEIGTIMGISKQAVDEKIKNALRKSEMLPKTKKQDIRAYTAVKKRLARKEALLEGIELEREYLLKEIEELKVETEWYRDKVKEPAGGNRTSSGN